MTRWAFWGRDERNVEEVELWKCGPGIIPKMSGGLGSAFLQWGLVANVSFT